MEFVIIVVAMCLLIISLGQQASARETLTFPLEEDEEIEIFSPEYPDNFDLNLDYLGLVSTFRGRNIHLDFTELHLRENLDFIIVGEGINIYETTVFLNLTGGDPIPTPIVSPNETLWIWFTSGGQGDRLVERRFKLKLKETQRIFVDENDPSQITSRDYPSDYPNNYHQLWFVSCPSGSRIRILFLDFVMEQEADYLTIGTDWGAAGENDHVLVRYSGEFLPDDVVTPVGEVWIEMVTDQRRDDDGFRIALQSQKTEPTLNNYLLGYQTLNLLSPNYPDSNYPDDADISWIFTCEPSFKLLFLFDELDTESGYDVLVLGDGTDPDDYSTTLEEYSGRSTGEGAFSISSETWLRFTTDSHVNYDGFSLQIYAVESDAEVRRNITFKSEGQANVFSPEFPSDYPNYSDELWTISAPSNHLIRLQFKHFILEDVQYDSVTIGTGRHPSDVDSEVIGVYGGDVVPNDIESAIPYLWVHFMSDSSITFQGFWIVVTSIRIEVPTTLNPPLVTTRPTTSSLSTRYETSIPSSTTSYRTKPSSIVSPHTKSTVDPTDTPKTDTRSPTSIEPTRIPSTMPSVIQSEDPTVVASTEPTISSMPSEDPSSTRSLAPSQASNVRTMSSAPVTVPFAGGSKSILTSISTSSWTTESGVPESDASQTDLKKVVVPVAVISILVLIGLLLLFVLWRVRRARNSPFLVDDDGKNLDEDECNHHSNPAYEYHNMDHFKLDSTRPHSTSHSIKKPLPRPPTELVNEEEDDHRYSTYIDTMNRNMMSNDLAKYGVGDRVDDKDRDNDCDESGIGIDEYHHHPHRGSNIAIGIDDCPDIEYYGTSDFTTAKSVDGQSDNEVYQEIPFEQEIQQKLATDSGLEKKNVGEISNKFLKASCSDDLFRSRSDSDAIVASLIDNNLYVPVEQNTSWKMNGTKDKQEIQQTRVADSDSEKKIVSEISNKLLKAGCSDDIFRSRSDSDAIGASLIDNNLYAPLEQATSGSEHHANDTNTIGLVGRDGGQNASDKLQEPLYDDNAPLDDTFYYIVKRNESDDERLDEQIHANPTQNRYYLRNENDVEIEFSDTNVQHTLCKSRNESLNDLDNDGDDASHDYFELDHDDDIGAVNDPEYEIVDRNDDDDGEAEGIGKHEGDNEEANDTGIVRTSMEVNELYRPLSIAERSENLELNYQLIYQNDTLI